jgi:hypothetical protein
MDTGSSPFASPMKKVRSNKHSSSISLLEGPNIPRLEVPRPIPSRQAAPISPAEVDASAISSLSAPPLGPMDPYLVTNMNALPQEVREKLSQRMKDDFQVGSVELAFVPVGFNLKQGNKFLIDVKS